MRWRSLRRLARTRHVTDATFVAPAWGVLTSHQDALIILLSLRTDRLYTLDETGSTIWKLVGTGDAVGAVIAAAEATFERSDYLASHVHSFIADLVQKDILSAGRRPRPPASSSAGPRRVSGVGARRTPPGSLSVVLCLATIAAGLKVVGTERVWRVAHGTTRGASLATDPEYVETITRAVRLAAVMCPWRARCLHQSLATLFFLRKAGVDAHLRFGVQQYPFYAHAWVEVAGVPVNDNVEILKLYRPLAFFDIGCA